MPTDITVTAAEVAPVFEKFGKAEIHDHVAGVTITAGEAVYIVSATGLLALADASSGNGAIQANMFRGIALNGGGAGSAISVLSHGCVYGFDLSSENYDALMFLSETAGALADGASGITVECGRVFPLSDIIVSTGLPTKVLFVDVDPAQADHA